jgi:class I lanthipeptide synthase
VGEPRHAAAARAVVARVLDRLADPAATAAGTLIPGAARPEGVDLPLWVDLSLSSGFPGVSLAFAGTTPRGRAHTARAHGYLTRAMAALSAGEQRPAGIYSGPGAVAYAVLVAHRATGGYVSALDRLDDYQRRLVRGALPGVTDRPLPTNGAFEVVRGMTGVGRYLLARGESGAEELRLVLSWLVALADGEIGHRGQRVPRWWTTAAPKLGQEVELPDGHLNLGLSHGIAGPLALLSLAWRAGVVVDGQREAITSIVALLTRWAVPDPDGDGVSWPGYLTLDRWIEGPGAVTARQRPSWCYGVPGVSRAIQLAALALGRADWHDLARRSLVGLLTRPVETWDVDDPALCHGWGGLLHVLGTMNESLGDPRLTRVCDELAAVVIARFRTDHRFGFRSTMTHVAEGADVPAFLEGAAGVAVALDAYAEGRAAGRWDEALLVT